MDLQFTSGLDSAIAATRAQLMGLLAILAIVPLWLCFELIGWRRRTSSLLRTAFDIGMKPCAAEAQILVPLPNGAVCKNVLQGAISDVEAAWVDCEYFEPCGESLHLRRETVIALRVVHTSPRRDSSWLKPSEQEIGAIQVVGVPESWQIRRASEWLLLRKKGKLLPPAELQKVVELATMLSKGPRPATPIVQSRASMSAGSSVIHSLQGELR